MDEILPHKNHPVQNIQFIAAFASAVATARGVSGDHAAAGTNAGQSQADAAPTRAEGSHGDGATRIRDSAFAITAFVDALFDGCEVWAYDLLARCRALLKALSISIEGQHELEHKTDLTPAETERLLGNLQAMAVPSRRARKLVQFLDTLKGATTPIVADILRSETGCADFSNHFFPFFMHARLT